MPVLLWCAFLIATSRIMLGMHFLSDVVVGALIGTSLGYVAFLFV
jgi:undecaprenyl-diphosphatase